MHPHVPGNGLERDQFPLNLESGRRVSKKDNTQTSKMLINYAELESLARKDSMD